MHQRIYFLTRATQIPQFKQERLSVNSETKTEIQGPKQNFQET